jgi:Rrf2 family transcriptional regulator, iron-sulfur cluster assembly transcription factor
MEMKITAMQEYGLRCILQLAAHKGPAPLTVREIAKSERLTPVYVAKLLVTLRRSGLVRSLRGVNGGYALSQEASGISVARVLSALGQVELGKDLCKRFPGTASVCTHMDNCSIRPVWGVLTQYIFHFLNQLTLDQLVQDEVGVIRQINRIQTQYAAPALKFPLSL